MYVTVLVGVWHWARCLKLCSPKPCSARLRSWLCQRGEGAIPTSSCQNNVNGGGLHLLGQSVHAIGITYLVRLARHCQLTYVSERHPCIHKVLLENTMETTHTLTQTKCNNSSLRVFRYEYRWGSSKKRKVLCKEQQMNFAEPILSDDFHKSWIWSEDYRCLLQVILGSKANHTGIGDCIYDSKRWRARGPRTTATPLVKWMAVLAGST